MDHLQTTRKGGHFAPSVPIPKKRKFLTLFFGKNKETSLENSHNNSMKKLAEVDLQRINRSSQTLFSHQ